MLFSYSILGESQCMLKTALIHGASVHLQRQIFKTVQRILVILWYEENTIMLAICVLLNSTEFCKVTTVAYYFPCIPWACVRLSIWCHIWEMAWWSLLYLTIWWPIFQRWYLSYLILKRNNFLWCDACFLFPLIKIKLIIAVFHFLSWQPSTNWKICVYVPTVS